VLVVAIVAVVAAVALSGDPTPRSLSTTQVKARQGDTLWSLASAHPVAGLSTAQTTALIAELNDVRANALPAGSTLRVPLQVRSDTYAMR
jgi:Tfp pilus assembly protein FimV